MWQTVKLFESLFKTDFIETLNFYSFAWIFVSEIWVMIFAPRAAHNSPLTIVDQSRADQWPVWVNGVYKIFILAACLLLHIKHSVVILITCRHTFIIFSSNSPQHTHAAPAPSTLTQPITNQTRLKEDDYPWGFYLSVFKWWNNVHTWTIGFALLQYFTSYELFS